MKPLIYLGLALFLISSCFVTANAGSSCGYHHRHHYSGHYNNRYYYASGYCVERCDDQYTCGCREVCYPARYYDCRTDFYYHRGRNTARVEVCG